MLATIFLLAALAVETPAAEEVRPDPPLLAIFKSLCVDTGAEGPAVRAAAVQAGFVVVAPPGDPRPEGWPILEAFEKTIGGAEYTLLLDHGDDAAGKDWDGREYPASTWKRCFVKVRGDDDGSLSAVFAWLRILPTDSSSETWGEITRYLFHERPTGRVRIPNYAGGADLVALREGPTTSVFTGFFNPWMADVPDKETSIGIIVTTAVAAP